MLQANDVLGKLAVCPYHGKKLPPRCAFNGDAKSTSSGEKVADAGVRSCAADGKAKVADDTKDRPVLTTLFDRFCQWLSETRRHSSLLRFPLTKSRSRRSSSLRRSPDDDDDGGVDAAGSSSSSLLRGRRSSRRLHSRRRCNSASPSSIGDLNDPAVQHGGSGAGSRAMSTCSSATTSTACSDVTARSTGDVIGGTETASGLRGRHSAPLLQRSARSGNDVSTVGFLEKSDTGSGQCENSLKDECSALIATWPSVNGTPATSHTTQWRIQGVRGLNPPPMNLRDFLNVCLHEIGLLSKLCSCSH